MWRRPGRFLFADGWVVDRDSHEIKRCEPDLIITQCSGMPFRDKKFSKFEASGLIGSSSWTGRPLREADLDLRGVAAELTSSGAVEVPPVSSGGRLCPQAHRLSSL